MRSATFLAVVATLVLLFGGAAGVLAYDRGHKDRIAAGVRVGGIDIGGLDRAAARAKLRDELVRPLRAPVVVRARGERFTLSAQVSHIRADVDAMVGEALARSRRGNLLSRTLRGLTGGDVRADVEPEVRYSAQAVRRLARRVARHTDRPARDASVRFTGAGIEKVRERTGLRVDRAGLRERVDRALVRPAENGRIVAARVRRVRPKVTTAALARRMPTIVTVNRGAFTLRLYKHLRLVRSYPIAVGRAGLETPAGRYAIQNKAVDPAWHVPNSAWAGSLAGHVVPGGAPDNPLKARWMGIYAGAGIHGTSEDGSIGSSASHGCIRMHVADVIDLYDRVPVGAPVFIA